MDLKRLRYFCRVVEQGVDKPGGKGAEHGAAAAEQAYPGAGRRTLQTPLFYATAIALSRPKRVFPLSESL